MNKDEPLTTSEAAEYLNISESHLAALRSKGKSPKFYKPNGKLIYYYTSDLDAWIKQERENNLTAKEKLELHEMKGRYND